MSFKPSSFETIKKASIILRVKGWQEKQCTVHHLFIWQGAVVAKQICASAYKHYIATVHLTIIATFQRSKILPNKIINCCELFWHLLSLHTHTSITQTGNPGFFSCYFLDYFMSHKYLKQHPPLQGCFLSEVTPTSFTLKRTKYIACVDLTSNSPYSTKVR